MRSILFVAVATMALLASAQSTGDKAPETKKPIMVDSLTEASHVTEVKHHADAPVAAQPASHERELKKLEQSIVDHEQTLEALQKQLMDGVRQKQRLIVAQKLMTAIIALKKAERVLGEVDARIDAAKANIKKFGEHAEEIGESIKHSESEHRKEIADLNKKLEGLKKDLSAQEKTLNDLVSKRGRIASTVNRWKEHVATLRDAHEAASLPSGVPVSHGKKDDLAVPEPPSDVSILSAIGIVAPKPAAARPVIAADVTNLDRALNDVAKRTFAELGQGRFASLRGASRASVEEADESAELEEIEESQ